ncbi:MAG TPA: hypothetical protein VFP98_06020 [Candidatus Polarisedimenticolia bacterium]|nr:hypothetical protein [Candidatus Polarisedimenticolia bacterium]
MTIDRKKLTMVELERRSTPFTLYEEPVGEEPLGGGGGGGDAAPGDQVIPGEPRNPAGREMGNSHWRRQDQSYPV